MSGDRSHAESQTGGSKAARWAGMSLLVGSVQFVIGMAITQLGWTTPYSLASNYISDLGAAHCGYWTGVNPRYICSPWHGVFDTSIVTLGLLSILAAVLLWRSWGPGKLRLTGLVLLAASGVGAIGVGLSPEDVNLTVHTLSALLSFAAGSTALLVFGASLWRYGRWGSGYGTFSALLGLIGWSALVLFVAQVYGPLGVGGMERLIVAPVLLWAAVVGARLMWMERRGSPGPSSVAS